MYIAFNFNSHVENEGLQGSEAVMFCIKAVISWKRCTIETMLRRTTNRKLRGLLNCAISDDLESSVRSFAIACLSNAVFGTDSQQLTRFTIRSTFCIMWSEHGMGIGNCTHTHTFCRRDYNAESSAWSQLGSAVSSVLCT